MQNGTLNTSVLPDSDWIVFEKGSSQNTFCSLTSWYNEWIAVLSSSSSND